MSPPPAPFDGKPSRLRAWAKAGGRLDALAERRRALCLMKDDDDATLAAVVDEEMAWIDLAARAEHAEGGHASNAGERSALAGAPMPSVNGGSSRRRQPLMSPPDRGWSALQRDPELPAANAALSRFNLEAWERHLVGYRDRAWILQSIREGVRVGYKGDRAGHEHQRNHGSALSASASAAIDKEIRDEVAAGRMVGPFSRVPAAFTFSRTSPLAVVPKADGGDRIIDDLSAAGPRSVNAGIDDADATVHYASFDDALRLVARLGRGCLLGKLDWQAAYRQIAVHREDWPLLGLAWRGYLFFRLVLPFGLRSSPQLFCRFTRAFRWILRRNDVAWLVGYLDDFLFGGAALSDECQRAMAKVEAICAELGIALHPKKRAAPSQYVVFLGLGIDTALMRTFLPDDKKQRLVSLCAAMLQRRAASLRELQVVLGLMVHAGRVLQPARLMCRQLVFVLRRYSEDRPRVRQPLPPDALGDLEWWIRFLPAWNGVGIIPAQVAWEKELVQADACRTGGGAVGPQGQWFHYPWPQAIAAGTAEEWPMPVLELLAIVLALETWGPLVAGRRVWLHSDCSSMVHAWNRQRTKSAAVLPLLRTAHAVACRYRFHLSMSHIAGVWNVAADCASRLSEGQQSPSAEQQRAAGLLPTLRVSPAGTEIVEATITAATATAARGERR